jgi:hypothetical protein
MNTNIAIRSLVDKHPLHTGTLFLMVIGAFLLLYGIAYLILKNK